jgi:hypothetical protein
VRPFVRFALRDALLAVLTLVLVALDARLASVGGWHAHAVGSLAGVMVTLLAFLVHEWGHLAGTLASGGVAHAPPSLAAIFLFHFDVSRSTRRQFLAMSYGGYAATAAALVPLALWIDLARTSGLVALVLSVAGIGVTLALEIPTTVRVARGAELPSGGVYVGKPGA